MAAVYAQGTEVPPEKSAAEIQAMLKSLGAQRMGIMHSPAETVVVFDVRGAMYRIATPPLTPRPRVKAEQLEREAWRALVLLVKAKKVAIEQKITTVEKEFMADTVMPDGSTLLDHREAIITHNYREGGAPRLLGFSNG
jgi:succinylarginine dihydrolase